MLNMSTLSTLFTSTSIGLPAQPPSWADVETAENETQNQNVNDVFSRMESFNASMHQVQAYQSDYQMNMAQEVHYTQNGVLYTSGPEQYSYLHPSVVYTPECQYSSCSSSNRLIYKLVAKYIATLNELMENGYPMFFDGQTKMVTIPETTFTRGKNLYLLPEDKIRRCTRCRSHFELENNGRKNQRSCVYHPKGIIYDKVRKEEIRLCCNQKAGFSAGCEVRRFHVFDQILITELETFLPTEKPKGINDARSTNVLAIDAEMVYTTSGPALARLSVVNFDGQLVMDIIVKPSSMVIDPNTEYSGLTFDDINSATDTLESCRNKFFTLVNERSILVGHSLESDLKALRITHSRVVDTSLLYLSKGFKVGLKKLALIHLGRQIQANNPMMKGHDSEEDARVALDLLKLQMGMS